MASLRDTFSSTGIAAAFDDTAMVRGMLAFERALAHAQSRCGLVPVDAAAAIADACAMFEADIAALAHDARRAGTYAIPFVKALTAAVKTRNAEAARWVHWGATSQDVQDCALALNAREASSLLIVRLTALGDMLADLAEAHRGTPIAGRTLLQPATPVSFGWKIAVWLSGVTRARAGIARATAEACVLQFGGASGVLASLGERGDDVADALARELALPRADIPWHAMRDALARLAAELGIACEVLGKIGGDVALLMQHEVGEAAEPTAEGRGGSSALPHKRNPVGAMLALDAAVRAPGLVGTMLAGVAGEHERGLGQWQAQWWTLGDLYRAAGSAAVATAEVIAGLEVHPAAMQRNLDATGGMVYAEAVSMALALTMGKGEAQARVEALCRAALAQRRPLREAIESDPELAAKLPASTLDALFAPASQFGSAGAMIDRVLAAWSAGGVD